MASQDDIRREEELFSRVEARAGVESKILNDLRDQSNVINDQLQNFRFQKAEKTEIRSLTREINKIASSNYDVSLRELGTQKQIAKINKDKETIFKRINSLQQLSNTFSKINTQEAKEFVAALGDQIAFTQDLADNLDQIQLSSEAIANSFSVKSFQGLANLVNALPGFGKLFPAFQQAADATRQATATNAVTKELFKTGKGLTQEKIRQLGLEEELGGLAGSAAAATAKKLGLDKKILEANNATLVAIKETANVLGDLAIKTIGVSLVNNFFKLSTAQTEFRRLTGETADNFTNLNDQLVSSIDSIKTLTSLTEKFGFNANNAFSQINVQEAAELEVLMGLSADEAAQLAYFAQATGNNLNTVVTNINDSTDGAISVKKVLQDVGNISQSIAITFGDNLELLGKTAAQARLLGLNLQQVDKIAEGLLDIEQSLTAEFEAEVIAGQQLNLERARYFALTNDLVSLTEEIGRNEEVISIFAGNNRIAQEAIAASLNLSRDEVAKMVNDQRILSGMTAEEREQTRLDEKKRLSAQESLAKSVEKLTVALAGPVEAFAAMASNSAILYGVLGVMASLSLARLVTSVLTLSSALTTAGFGATALGTALTFGGVAVAVGLAVAGLAAYIKSAQNQVSQNVKDGIASSSRGPFTITDSYGATAITARGDSLAVSPNIRRDDRNSGTTIDYDKLADAIAKGAEKGTSRATVVTNLDGDRVSTRLQPSLAVNTRRYSV